MTKNTEQEKGKKKAKSRKGEGGVRYILSRKARSGKKGRSDKSPDREDAGPNQDSKPAQVEKSKVVLNASIKAPLTS